MFLSCTCWEVERDLFLSEGLSILFPDNKEFLWDCLNRLIKKDKLYVSLILLGGFRSPRYLEYVDGNIIWVDPALISRNWLKSCAQGIPAVSYDIAGFLQAIRVRRLSLIARFFIVGSQSIDGNNC